MDAKLIRVVTKKDIREALGKVGDSTPIEFTKDYTKNLKTNLLTPSKNQSYSCCIEYILKWFYSKFPDNFFKQKHIELEHMLNQRIRYTTRELMTTDKPAVSIRASLDHSFNREMLDQYNWGANLYSNLAHYRDAFFKDVDKKLFISMNLEILMMNFSFRLLFAEQAIQIDVGQRCALVFRALATQKFYVDVDYHIPDELLVQLAEDTNNFVCPCTGNIRDAEAFVRYFNQRSSLALYYKFDPSKHKMQYFLRVPRCLVHIKTNEIQLDEGQRSGNLMNNYSVSFECQVRFPSPKFYAYYSIHERKSMVCATKLDENSFGIIVSSLAKVPEKNEKGWSRKVETLYRFQDKEVEDIKNKKLMSIEFKDLIGDLRDAIDMTKSLAISPEIFLDMRVYNMFRRVSITIDWINYKIQFNEPISSAECCIVLYIDGNYYADTMNVVKEYSKTRISSNDTQIQHRPNTDLTKKTSLGRAVDKVVEKEKVEDE